jgi:superfamily II DNA or RNA helicase
VSARLRALVPNSVQGAALLSCKLRVLSVLLPQLHKRGHRCLIFSSSTRMLDLIQACVLRVLGLKFLRIDGTIEAKDRDLKLQKFHETNSKYFCMCLSVQTGGTGLTITGADRVILVDPAWNPSTDAQAIDRVHRIGQKKDVVVYRLICSGAIEDKMFRLQVFKRGMSKTYLEQEQQVRFFSHKELKKLFEPPDRSSSTQALMAEQIGTEALEHEELLRVVASDIGDTADPDALPFWQSSDVLGFSDYQRLFMFLEQTAQGEEDAVNQAKAMAQQLQSEEYVKDQVVENKWRKHWLDAQKDAQATDGEGGASGSTFIEPPAPLQDA